MIKRNYDRWHIAFTVFQIRLWIVSAMYRIVRDHIQRGTYGSVYRMVRKNHSGTTRANGRREPQEAGHPAVHRWNYCVGDSDFSMSVGYKKDIITWDHQP